MTMRERSKIDQFQRDTIIAFLDDEPPVKIGALAARALGLKVEPSILSPGISGEIRPDSAAEAGYTIRVNRHETRERSKIDKFQRDTITAFLDDEPPVKIGALAKALGLKVKLSTLSPGISGEIRPDPDAEAGYTIRVNRHEMRERQRFTIAHEVAHFLLHRDHIGEGIADNVLYRSGHSDKIEAEANRLAAELVMPHAKVYEHLQECDDPPSDEEIEVLARTFQVSKGAMEIRVGA